MATAGAIGASTSLDGGESEVVRLRQRLLEPEQRRDAVMEALRRRHALGEVLPALERFDPDELLAVLPALGDVGGAAVPGLTKLLRTQNTELRQACALLLGNAHDERGLGPLCAMLFTEPSDAWNDAARALGAFGKAALPHLCSGVRETTTLPEQEWMTRLARAMAEVVLDEGDPSAVQELEASTDESIAYSATHALATLDAVRSETAQIRGEEPMPESTPAREFARRAHEALSVAELLPIEESVADVLGEADLEFI
jgi:HEAT repeat protein